MSMLFWENVSSDLELTYLYTPNITNMTHMFQESKVLILDLSSFNTLNVTDMSLMFVNAKGQSGYAKTIDEVTKLNTLIGRNVFDIH